MFRIMQNITIPNITAPQGSRTSLPVDPAFLIYAHFEHVYGKAAPQGTEGVAINQLRVLDVLIGRLAQIRRDAPPPIMAGPGEPASAHIDALIESYRAEILHSMEASAAMPYIPSPNAQRGAVLNVVA